MGLKRVVKEKLSPEVHRKLDAERRGARKDLKRSQQNHSLITERKTVNKTEEILCKVDVLLRVSPFIALIVSLVTSPALGDQIWM